MRIGPGDASAVFLAELRSTVRRVRTLVFVALAASGIIGTLVLAMLATGEAAPLAGAYAPQFVLSAAGNTWLWLFLVATVFLAFDARQQDERARVAEVLDARPITNLSLLWGRLVATVMVTWLALVVIAVLIQVVGTVGRMVADASALDVPSLGWRFAVAVEPTSLVTLLTVDALPALAFAGALVMFLATALRSRALTVVVGLALIAMHIYAVAVTPMFVLPSLSLVTSYAAGVSEVVPTVPDPAFLVQRAAIVSLAGAFLIGAAALHPRDDGGSRSRRAAVAVVLALGGIAGIAGVLADAVSQFKIREQWLAAHEAASSRAFPNLRHMSGEVWIEPGRELVLELDLRLAAPAGEALERLYLGLNPGLEARAVEIAGTSAQARHVDGILAVELPKALAPGAELNLSLHARGMPDERFAYLDSAVDWRRLRASSQLSLLGTEALIFSKAYVALMPGSAWLPTTRPNLADASLDLFTVDLAVHVPETWLVAGPGRRETLAPGSFRFQPGAPVPAVGIFASRFERRATETEGVALELLVAPEHAGHLDGLAEVVDGPKGIIARVGEMLAQARERGLPYPYRGISMVEVPAGLRRYGGGLQLGTTLFPPGLVLVPEYGFPTRFERVYRDRRVNFRVEPVLGTETANRKHGVLYRLFRYEDAADGLHHAASHAFSTRSTAEGTARVALDALCRELASRVVWSLFSMPSGLFSAHRFVGEPAGRANPLRLLVWGGGPLQVRSASDGPTVWEAAQQTALADLGSIADPGLAMAVLRLRVDHVANATLGQYGLEEVANMLVELRRRSPDAVFTVRDFRQASADVGLDIDALLGDWLNATAMPGFRASVVEAFRIADSDDGRPRYQALVNVRNDEPVPGLISLSYAGRIPGTDFPRFDSTEPIPVGAESAVQVGRVLDQPPDAIWLRTFLSRNRDDLHLPVPTIDAEKLVDREPVTGATPSDWRPRHPGIVVDDLDEGFSVDSTASTLLGGGWTGLVAAETDSGLPVYQRGTQPGWVRQPLPTAWGRYRRTVARIVAGQGADRAVFAAELPEAGRWRLDYHVASLRMVGLGTEAWGPGDEQGVYTLEITNGGTVTTVDFDAAAASLGWNAVDVLDLVGGHVGVAVSDRTTGRSVVADAIRWERQAR